MTDAVLIDRPLTWSQVADVAAGAKLGVADAARARVSAARALVESIVVQGVRAYGVNTGVGALCDVVVTESKQAELSRNIVMSHAVG
ncbi:MAG TPA: aromatic amino acid lyase, partial [Steroidobacteraceae bacterium]|nr:aromatic amino acid lyase [Steroidobacteraceae bacterium]